MSIFKRDKNREFWDWFSKNSESYYNFEQNQDALFDELAKRLHKISPYACFEFSPVIDGKREFILSADGIISGARAIQVLVQQAPKLDNWNIFAFRQRQAIDRVDFGDHVLHVHDVQYSYTFNVHNALDLTLYVSDYDDKKRDDHLAALFVLLDSLVGEYDVMTKIGSIDVRKPHNPPQPGLRQLGTLPELLDTRRRNNLP